MNVQGKISSKKFDIKAEMEIKDIEVYLDNIMH